MRKIVAPSSWVMKVDDHVFSSSAELHGLGSMWRWQGSRNMKETKTQKTRLPRPLWDTIHPGRRFVAESFRLVLRGGKEKPVEADWMRMREEDGATGPAGLGWGEQWEWRLWPVCLFDGRKGFAWQAAGEGWKVQVSLRGKRWDIWTPQVLGKRFTYELEFHDDWHCKKLGI